MSRSFIEPSSYKDRDAVVFIEDDIIYRKIFPSYFSAYEKLMNSGLYEKLVAEELLIPHDCIDKNDDFYILKPKKVFISYPWEWSFSQLKAAALSTLKIQKIALEYGMSLKDANFFNIQFWNNNPVLIDTTSFEIYSEGQPWVAYKQFCENFLNPLALISLVDYRLKYLLLNDISGISLDITSNLLPLKTWFNLKILSHIHLHAKFQSKTDSVIASKNKVLTKEHQIYLLGNLIETVESLNLKKYKTEWAEYYNCTNYSDKSFELKKTIISQFRDKINSKSVIDFGSNTGYFSRLFGESSSVVYSVDIDDLAVEANYEQVKKKGELNIFPLRYDIMNPTPFLGFNNEERKDLKSRVGEVDVVLALALLHHLAITYNLPLDNIAKYFSSWGKYLIIEFVSKEDSMLVKMLSGRKDIFDDYSEIGFEKAFSKYYNVIEKRPIEDTNRVLYLLERVY